MGRLLCTGVNFIFRLMCRRAAFAHHAALTAPEPAQQARLFKILRENQNTVYGRAHHFLKCNSVESFRAHVPLTTYEDYEPYIKRISSGEKNVLTAQPVRLLEPTSGSSGARKLIPYTSTLQSEFEYGIKAWLYNLYTECPRAAQGESYWSITPLSDGLQYTAGGIPIGFEKDSAYFGGLEQYLIERTFVNLGDIQRETDMDRFYYRTAYGLLLRRSLALVSVWNPTFLFLILDYIKAHTDKLLPALPKGRRKEVEKALAIHDFERLWPNLCIISCWLDGNAAAYHNQLTALFPHVLIQPKGLLATEAFVSFPLIGQEGSVLAVGGHYFELIGVTDGAFYNISMLREGAQYEVVLTTSGGLYRYRIGDIIEVIGYEHRTGAPLVRFVGRQGRTSDLFGEKLTEGFVSQTLGRQIDPKYFYLLAPEGQYYVLYTDKPATPDDAETIDRALRAGFHYDYCRKLGQLQCLRIFHLTADARQEYLKACTQQGQRLGDIKPQVLVLHGGWEKVFTGHFI